MAVEPQIAIYKNIGGIKFGGSRYGIAIRIIYASRKINFDGF